MAEAQQKRLREESHDAETLKFDDLNSNSKRQKPYSNILSLLDEEEEQAEEPSQDLSAIFTTLEQELSSSTTTTFDFDAPPFTAEEEAAHHHQTTTTIDSSTSATEADDGVKSVIRHLLEASDDELGIPNTENKTVEINSAENFPFAYVDNGLWEIEDVAADYYTILQSELFM